MDIGTLLRDVRDKAALTQAELAVRAGVSQAMVSAVERGSRQPSITVVTRILAALELQPVFGIQAAQPPDAELDAAIDAVLSRPPAERLTGRWFDGPGLLRMLEPVEPVVEGAAGASLHGAPVPVRWLDVAVERSRIRILEKVIREGYAERWSEVWQRWGMESSDPRAPGPLRWEHRCGEFRVRWVEERPESVTVLVGDLPAAVRVLHEIEASDPLVRHALTRIRTRLPPDRPPPAGRPAPGGRAGLPAGGAGGGAESPGPPAVGRGLRGSGVGG